MKSSAMPALSVVIPTLNEAESLPSLLERLYNALYAAHIPFEIIIVDDHSSDGTAELAKSAAKKYHVRLLMKQGKPGKAYSLQEGFKAANNDLICMIDADLQYPPEAINRMYHKLLYCNADIVITNRTDQQTSALRRLSSSVFHLVFTRALFGIDYDTQSGLKLFKKRVLRDMTISPSPWTFDLEFIVRALENQYVILSEDIIFSKRYAGEAKINILSATLEMAWQSLKLRRKVATKQVRGQYRHLQPLQQSFNWLLIFVVGILLTLGVIGQKVSGQEVPHQAKPGPSKLLTITTPLIAAILPPAISPITDTTPTTTDPAPTDDSTAPTDPTAAASTTATPPPTTSSDDVTSTAQPKTTHQASHGTSNPQTTSGENKVYYPSSKLSTSKTNRWLSLALRILEIGVGLVVAALILLGIRGLARKFSRSHEHGQQTLGGQTR